VGDALGRIRETPLELRIRSRTHGAARRLRQQDELCPGFRHVPVLAASGAAAERALISDIKRMLQLIGVASLFLVFGNSRVPGTQYSPFPSKGRSTGSHKILRVTAEWGSPAPEFETDEDRTSFLIRLPVHSAALPERAREETPHVGTKLALSRHRVEIMRTCPVDTPLRELIALTGRTDRTEFRNQILVPMMEDEHIVTTIPDKPRSPNRRYRLTDMVCGLRENMGGNA